jgi:hypothetical protein
MGMQAHGCAAPPARAFRPRTAGRVTVPLALLMLVAAAGAAISALPARTLDESCSPSITPKNAPSDFACVAAVTFSSKADATLTTATSVTMSVSKTSSAPSTDEKTLKVNLAKGWGGVGSDPAVVVDRPLTGGAAMVYIVAVVKVQKWGDPESQADNVIELSLAGAGAPPDTKLSLALMTMDGANLTPAIRLSGLDQGYSAEQLSLKSFQPMLPPNESAVSAKLTQGVWHTWEILVTLNSAGSANGEITWWVDTKRAGAYSGFGFAPGTPAITGVRWVTLGHQPLDNPQTLWLDELDVSAPAVAAVPDRIDIIDNALSGGAPAPAAETVVLIDAGLSTGTATACVRDSVLHKTLSFTNLVHSPCEADEIVLFSVDHAVLLDGGTAGVIWKDAQGETRTEKLAGLIDVPVHFWITVQSVVVTDSEGKEVEVQTKDLALSDLAYANTKYNMSRVGIRLVPVVHDVSNGAALTAIGSFCNAEVRKSANGGPFFAKDTLNVYYVAHMAKQLKGYHCYSKADPVDSNMIYVDASTHGLATLAHEIGHAFGLQHVNPVNFGDGFSPDNLMWDGASNGERSSFTLGQVYQMNLEQLSMLNQNKLRMDSKDCDSRVSLKDPVYASEVDSPDPKDKACPRLSKGW